jgi:hypothetical protein
MAEPHFQILDVVLIAAHPNHRPGWLAGQRACVTEIREYPGAQFRYHVVGLDVSDEDDEVSGIYDEGHLERTGERAPAEMFALPGGLRCREVVRVAADCDEPLAAGRIGVVDGTVTGEGAVGVWFEELAESLVLWPQFLTATGDRLPPPPPGRAGHSTLVSTTGQVTGRASYIIVDDLERHT